MFNLIKWNEIINIHWFELIDIFVIYPNTILSQGTDALSISKKPANGNRMEFE